MNFEADPRSLRRNKPLFSRLPKRVSGHGSRVYEGSEFYAVLHESFDGIPENWGDLCKHDDLAMDIDLLKIFASTLADQCQCWGVIVYRGDGRPIGCAALCLFSTELLPLKNGAPAPALGLARRVIPRLATVKVVFCGLPIPAGSDHLRCIDDDMLPILVEKVNEAMETIASAHGAMLLVFKELDATTRALQQMLEERGFLRGDIPPLHLLEASFADFSSYQRALKSRYRAQIRRSLSKLDASGCEVLQGRGFEFFRRHYDLAVHRLYESVHRKADQKLEIIPLSFFSKLAQSLDDELYLTLIVRENSIKAFTISIFRAHHYYNLYSGLDYASNEESDLYFNITYADMGQAFRAGATRISFGQTADGFKSRLGTTADPRYFFVKARPAFVQFVFGCVAPKMLPRIDAVQRHDVFSQGGGRVQT